MSLRAFSAAVALAAVFIEGTARAEDQAAGQLGDLYLGVMSGAVIPEDVHFSRSAVAANGYSLSNGEWAFDNGRSFSAFVGYRFTDYVRGEAELSYAEFNYEKVTGTFTIPLGGGFTATTTGSADVAGRVSAMSGLVRGIVTPFGRSRLTPLLGAGFGLSGMKDRLDRIGPMVVNSETSSTVLAAEGMLGFACEIAAGFEAGVRYRYMWIGSGHDGVDNFTAHNVLATLTYSF